MIPDPETLKRVRTEAEPFVLDKAEQLAAVLPPMNDAGKAAIRAYLRITYLRGADAGYTAAKAEERKP